MNAFPLLEFLVESRYKGPMTEDWNERVGVDLLKRLSQNPKLILRILSAINDEWDSWKRPDVARSVVKLSGWFSDSNFSKLLGYSVPRRVPLTHKEVAQLAAKQLKVPVNEGRVRQILHRENERRKDIDAFWVARIERDKKAAKASR